MRKFIFFTLSFLSLFAYAGQQTLQTDSSSRLTVLDDNHTPVGNATVMIGMAPNNPFPGNVITTNAGGQVDLPSQFQTAQPVTVSANGYVTQTYLGFVPGTSQMIQMHHADGQSKIEIAGTTTNYPGIVNGDGKIHFGLVMPALNREDMMSFDMSTIISPENDTISVVGQSIQIPSNLALPKQSQTYIVMPINLNKPAYRYYVRDPGTYTLTALHGYFPLKQVVDDMRAGKSILDEINYFTFATSGNISVEATADSTGHDISLNQSQMSVPVNANAPTFGNGNAVLSLAMAETSSGQYFATDIKRMTSGQPMTMKTIPNVAGTAIMQAMVANPSSVPAETTVTADDLLNVAKHLSRIFNLFTDVTGSTPNMNQLSIVLQNAGDAAPMMMPLINPPTLANGQIQLSAPTLPAGLQAIGTYAVYSDILPTGGGQVHSEIRTRLWELWNDGFVNNMTLPQVTFPTTPGHTYRWEVLYLAKPTSAGPVLGDRSFDINTVTHISRNILNVQ